MNDEEAEEHEDISPRKVGGFMLLCAVFLPYWLMMTPSDFYTWAGIWMLKIFEAENTIHHVIKLVGINLSWGLLIFVGGPQILFAYFMYRLYTGKTTTKNAFVVGSLGIIPPLIFLLNALILGIYPTIPIPLSLLLGYVLVKKYPPPVDTPPWLQ
ncbi:MAG: hypothetical protein KGY80_00765 [Candidatus Thorarchaeota archaeon]|nr:hypothetical protein [Candidatus Thorarchaeota archaeon]